MVRRLSESPEARREEEEGQVTDEADKAEKLKKGGAKL